MTGALDEILVDGDDLNYVLVELERSFDVQVPHDLGHVKTVGDLFAEIKQIRQSDGGGERCDTAMAFYLLRRQLRSVGLPGMISPQTPLAGRSLPSPRTFAKRLDEHLQMPGIVISKASCIASLAILTAAAGSAVLFGSFQWLLLWLAALPLLALDRGQWAGDWATAGSLSRAIAIRNVQYFSARGARNEDRDRWRSFSHLLSGVAFTRNGKDPVDARELGPETRFKFN